MDDTKAKRQNLIKSGFRMRLALIVFTSFLVVACTTTAKEKPASKPLSLQLDEILCDIGEPCNFTGEFERLAVSVPSAADALYTYDYEDRLCVLLIGDFSDLANYEAIKKEITLRGSEFINITGQGIDRRTIPEWSGSDFCDDREVIVKIESIEGAFLSFHER